MVVAAFPSTLLLRAGEKLALAALHTTAAPSAALAPLNVTPTATGMAAPTVCTLSASVGVVNCTPTWPEGVEGVVVLSDPPPQPASRAVSRGTRARGRSEWATAVMGNGGDAAKSIQLCLRGQRCVQRRCKALHSLQH